MGVRAEYLSIVWACISSWYYGYHLSELNFPVDSLTCSTSETSKLGLPLCLGLDPTKYGLVTGIFTLGGLVGSLISSRIVHRNGMKGGLIWTGWINLLGSMAMTLAPHWIVLALGRFVVGLSSGIGICLVSPYLNLVAKSSSSLASRSGQVGTFNQLAIVLGICMAQIAGLVSTGGKGDIPGNWRYIVAVSGVVAVLQVMTSKAIIEPGTDRATESLHAGQDDDEDGLAERGGVTPSEDDEVNSPLLPEGVKPTEEQLSLHDILSNPALRSPALFCAFLMAIQQLGGINAVIFYSTPVLRPLLPSLAGIVGIGITVVNALMTIPAIFLMDRLGRKTLLLTSVLGMGIMSVLLAIGLNGHYQLLSGCTIIAFIAAFSIGLGPVPFLLVAELVASPAIPAVSSLALSVNWITASLVALLFLPIRNLLSKPSDKSGHREGEGNVFYLFTIVLVIGGAVVLRRLK